MRVLLVECLEMKSWGGEKGLCLSCLLENLPETLQHLFPYDEKDIIQNIYLHNITIFIFSLRIHNAL